MMASNPMKTKSRNSFLLGIIVTLLITGAIIALLLLMLKQKDEELKALEEARVEIYTLKKDVKAGQTLTRDMFTQMDVNKNAVPSNATNLGKVVDSWFLQTKDGEAVGRDEYGLYLDRSGEKTPINSIMEIEKDANDNYYMNVEGERKQVNPKDVKTDEYGTYYIETKGDNKIRVYTVNATKEYYIYKINDTGVREKEYLAIKNVPVLAKVDMKANTVITSQLIVQSDEIVTDDTRQEQYNMITLPIDLMTNDYVDIRLKAPNGQNFIVISKTQVDIPMNSNGTYIPDTIKVNLREDEILAMSCAIVEAYGLEGSELYVTKYIEPAMQKAAIPTYVPNADVTAQILKDENGDGKAELNTNIVEMAKQELMLRYSETAKKARNDYLQQMINKVDSQEYLDNIIDGVEQNMGSSITTRKKYLESLTSGM